jgi:phosphopantothenoylcysteine synthetase/decarboxylase
MMTAQSNKQKVLYTIVCAAPPAAHIQNFIQLAQEQNWSTYVIATPYATRFMNIPLLTTLTGHPIKSDYRHPEEQDSLPKADAIVVVPATFNTINKWAAGITDTLATGILCESMRYDIPIVVVPYLKQQLAQHPAFSKNLALLRECGIHVLYEPEQYPSPEIVPWSMILDTLDQAIQTKETDH